ncbi:alanine racemase [Porticoccaceae bacterium]|nr:alanine racemase [Porticoccaceae bacterium]
MNLYQIETPCLLVDREKVQTNVTRLHGHLADLGVTLRPHGKTAKNSDVIHMALVGQQGGIAVSTLNEVDCYFSQGIKDIVYAVGIAPNKLNRVTQLIHKGAMITLILDSLEQVTAVSEHAQLHRLEIPIFIEVDCDGHRSGVNPDSGLLLELASSLRQQAGVRLEGVLTHAGESYNCTSKREIIAIAEQERVIAVVCAERLRAEGHECPVVSVGSTPTALFAADLTGVTEVRAGVFVFFDLVMAGLGVCHVDDIALWVLTSVIGHQKEKGWVITDSGWTSLSRDRGTAKQSIDQGYGLVRDAKGKPLDGLVVSATNQEHGTIERRTVECGHQPLDFDQYRIGTLLRILPNHACATGAMHDHYYVVDDDQEIVAT